MCENPTIDVWLGLLRTRERVFRYHRHTMVLARLLTPQHDYGGRLKA
jgi:hypothetical protein